MPDFNGLDLHLGNLARLSKARSRSISPENFTGEEGRGGMATEGTGAAMAGALGRGWKISPSVRIAPGETFSFVGQDKKGTLGPWIWVRVNDEWHPKIHTSCSRPIGPGAVFGDFEVVAGVSRIGGALCPLEDGGDDPPPQGGFLWFLLLWLKRFGLG